MANQIVPAHYDQLLRDLKDRIRLAQVGVTDFSVNWANFRNYGLT